MENEACQRGIAGSIPRWIDARLIYCGSDTFISWTRSALPGWQSQAVMEALVVDHVPVMTTIDLTGAQDDMCAVVA